MKVIFPKNNEAERRYAAEILLGSMLRQGFEIDFAEQDQTILLLNNGRKIIVEDHFLSRFPTPKSYLKEAAIPRKVSFLSKEKNPFLSENDLPLLFGTERCEVSEGQILLGCDVFAATFFCLTRWEEVVNQTRDEHGRFPAGASLSDRFGFLQRPIVDEMAALLRNAIMHLGENLPRFSTFKFWVTHDVDMLRLWPNWQSFLKKTGGDVLKRGDLKEAFFNVHSFFTTKFRHHPDPFETYDYLMDVSERHSLMSQFYFLAGGNTKFDNNMELHLPMAGPIIKQIHARGHKVGIHPSYLSAENEDVFTKEVQRFRNLSPQPVTHGRQHFLRFEAGKTWQFWEKNGLEVDSTLGYPEQSGFRCGTCTPFPVFDIAERKKLKLIEAPLTAMDTTYAMYQKASPLEMEKDILSLLKTVHKYRGTFVLLWHNSSFSVPAYRSLANVYENIIQAGAEADFSNFKASS